MKQNETEELKMLVLELQQQNLRNYDKNQEIVKLLEELKRKIENPIECPEIRQKWIPRDDVKKYFGYGDTQISYITKKYNITTTEVGKRKFYAASSLLSVLENNKH